MNFFNSNFNNLKTTVRDCLKSSIISAVDSNATSNELFQRMSSYFNARSIEVTQVVALFQGMQDLVFNDYPGLYYSEDFDNGSDILDAFRQLNDFVFDQDGHAITITLADGRQIHLLASNKTNYQRVLRAVQFTDGSPIPINTFTETLSGVGFNAGNLIDTSGSIVGSEELVSNLVSDSELLDVYQNVCAVMSEKPDPTRFNLVLSKLEGKGASVKQVVRDLTSAYASSGFSGVLNYFKNIYTDLSTVGTENGLLTFSDNSSLMPSDFTTGIISGIMNSAGTIAAALITVISPIIGIITYAIGSLVSLINQTFVDVYKSSTLAGVFAEGNIPAIPFAFSQKEYANNNLNITNADLRAAVDSGCPTIYDNYGAKILLSSNSSLVRVEGHIDCADRVYSLFHYFADKISSSQSYPYFIHELDFRSISKADLDGIEITGETSLRNDPETGCLSETNDRYLRAIIACNLFYNVIGNTRKAAADQSVTWTFKATTAEGLIEWNGNIQQDDGDFSNYDYAKKLGKIMYRVASAFATSNNVAFVITSISDGVTWTMIGEALSLMNAQLDYIDSSDVQRILARPGVVNYYNLNHFMNNGYAAPSSLSFPVLLPKYSRNGFWTNLAYFALAVVGVTAVTVGAAIGTKIALRKWAAKRSANVEHLWAAAVANPTSANVTAYTKAVKKNNIISTVFGGTKYDVSSYWNSPSNSSSDSLSIAKLEKIITG